MIWSYFRRNPYGICDCLCWWALFVLLRSCRNACTRHGAADAFVMMGRIHPSLIYLVKLASHEDTYSGHLSKFLNYVKSIFARQTSMCAFCPGWEARKITLPLFIGELIPCEKLNQRSHSCSVVPSVDKGWAVQCGRTVSMFSTDGCMPWPQFDNPVEGCGLCLKLGSESKGEQ